MVDKAKPADDRLKIEKEGGIGYHSFSVEERKGFSQLLSFTHRNDLDLADMLPINADSDDLFSAVGNGILLCKMINHAVPGTIDPRAINTKKPLNIFQIKENLTLAISSAKAIGCIIVSITPPLILEKREHIILGILWQILRIQIAQEINLKNHPYLIRLKREDEELQDLLKLPAEELLLRWFNYHLKNAGHNRTVTNFSGDVKDGVNYTILLNQLDKANCDKTGLDLDDEKRCNKVVNDSKTIGVPSFIKGSDIKAGDPKLNLLFCSEIFNHCPGLTPTEEEKYEAAALMNDDVGDSREERSFRMWVNSLNIDGVYVNNLYEEIKDGIVLLKVLERIQPAVVNWKKVEMKPSMRIKKTINSNYAVEIGRSMGFSLVGIGGIDLVDGKKKLTLALIWQMVRKHTLSLLGGWTEEKLLEWALHRVTKEPKIQSFKDKSISDCKFLFNLIYTIETRVINWDLVLPGQTPEEIENNAKYVISVARKLGATIFLVWEDIRDANHKMLMTFVAALALIADKGKQEEMPDISKKTEVAHH